MNTLLDGAMNALLANVVTVELLLIAAIVNSVPRFRSSLAGQTTEVTCLIGAAFSAWYVLVKAGLG